MQQQLLKSINLCDIFLFYVVFKHIFAIFHNLINYQVDFIINISNDFCDVSSYFRELSHFNL